MPTTAFGKRPERRSPTIFTRTTIASRKVNPAQRFLQLALIALLACAAAHASAADRVIITRASVDDYLSQGIISRDGSVYREGFQRLIDLMGPALFKQPPYPTPDKYLDLSYLARAHHELGAR